MKMEVYKCHRNSDITTYVCIKCLSLFHKSCAARDWKEKLLLVDGHKVICCDKQTESEKFQMNLKEIKQKNLLKNNRLRQLMAEKEYLLRESEEMERKMMDEIERQKKSISDMQDYRSKKFFCSSGIYKAS
ncbi:hypothetical protein HHI36_000800 [Cryptolaemus montrouzieri]|uniref:Uncharacterized protein n=1 Tax=Cryptolaemus montrouzieri TaxID=559131 RepID=A0ABD2P5W8_9CUCU